MRTIDTSYGALVSAHGLAPEQYEIHQSNRLYLFNCTGGGKQMASAKKKTKPGIQLQPLGDRVVVRRESSEATTSGGIVLPDSAKDKPARGVITGDGARRLRDERSGVERQL